MKKLLAASILILVLAGCKPAVRVVTTWPSDGTVADIQSIHDTQAQDGDTITLPAGEFGWTTRVNIAKGITLRGQTTIDDAGTINPVVVDSTIVRDDSDHTTNQIGLVSVTLKSTQSFRMTGITFRNGQSTVNGNNGAIKISSTGNQPVTSARIDHCHFDHLYWENAIMIVGWVYGVEDHNLIECPAAGLSHMIWHNTWGGQVNGHGSWADFPYYGTEKFWFIETNTIRGNGPQTSATIDSVNGGRYVARHNYFSNCKPGGHGTEGGQQRGAREREVYDNVFNFTISWGGGLQRSGGGLWHDNSWTGLDAVNLSHTVLSVFRLFGAIGNNLTLFGLAGGNNPWDMNDAHGLYESGTTSATLAHGLVQDSTKNWTTNQWAGYSVTNNNPSTACYLHSSYIISNTADTITFDYYGSGDRGAPLVFNTGDAFQIYRVITAMDQNGRGKGDLVTMTTGPSPIPVNSLTGVQSWTHEALEPCFSWNNVHSPSNHVYGFAGQMPTEIANRDYYNLGAGFPADTTPQQVINTYTAALNGVDYTQPFTYPHPLTSGGPVGSPAPTASVSASPTATVTQSASPTATAISSPTATATSTATQTPTATVTATATATQTAAPTVAPQPTATVTPVIPGPTLCVVPVLVGKKIKDAQEIWNQAGFATQVIVTSGAPGHVIASQNIPADSRMNCDTTFIRVSN